MPPQPVLEAGETRNGSVGRLDLRVVRRGEPQTVPHDRPADAGTDVVAREPAAPLVAEPDPRAAGECVVGEEGEDASLECVAPGVRHRIDRTSDRPTVPGVVAPLLDLDGSHEVVGQDEVRDWEHAGATKMGAGNVNAVDEVGVLE